MDWPAIVLLRDHPDGPMLYRYSASGELAGDTWHQTLHHARHQAEFEYEEALGGWREIPTDVPDADCVPYALG